MSATPRRTKSTTHPPSERLFPQGALLRAVVDLTIGLGTLAAVFWIRITLPLPGMTGLLPGDRVSLFAETATIVALTQNLLLFLFGFYDNAQPLGRLELLKKLSSAVIVQALFIPTFFFLTLTDFPRSILVLYAPTNLLLLFLFRYTYQRFNRAPLRRLGVVGDGRVVLELTERVERYHWHGFEVVGRIRPPGTEAEGQDSEALGSIDDLPELFARGDIDGVILAHETNEWHTRLIDQLAQSDAQGEVFLLPTPFQSLIGRARFRSIHDLALVEVISHDEQRVSDPVKRLFDLAVAATLLILASPIIAACALVVRTTSSGPIIFRQERVGRGRRTFILMKFRTMADDAEAETGAVLAKEGGDPRVTAIGRVLRRFRLDELPQLWNVLTGDMSLVGPRPERPFFVQEFIETIPGYAERFSVKPGLTGLAQVNGDYYTSAENKLRYDLAYAANWSIWLDLSILFLTAKIVLSRPGS